MSLNQVGQHIAQQMDAIEADYGGNCEIGDICTIVEVRTPQGSQIRMRSTAAAPHSTLGLLKIAEEVVFSEYSEIEGRA